MFSGAHSYGNISTVQDNDKSTDIEFSVVCPSPSPSVQMSPVCKKHRRNTTLSSGEVAKLQRQKVLSSIARRHLNTEDWTKIPAIYTYWAQLFCKEGYSFEDSMNVIMTVKDFEKARGKLSVFFPCSRAKPSRISKLDTLDLDTTASITSAGKKIDCCSGFSSIAVLTSPDTSWFDSSTEDSDVEGGEATVPLIAREDAKESETAIGILQLIPDYCDRYFLHRKTIVESVIHHRGK